MSNVRIIIFYLLVSIYLQLHIINVINRKEVNMLKMALKHLFRREIKAIKDMDNLSSNPRHIEAVTGFMSGEALVPTSGKIILRGVHIMDSLSPKNSVKNRLKMKILTSKVKASEVKDVNRRAFMKLLILEAL